MVGRHQAKLRGAGNGSYVIDYLCGRHSPQCRTEATERLTVELGKPHLAPCRVVSPFGTVAPVLVVQARLPFEGLMRWRSGWHQPLALVSIALVHCWQGASYRAKARQYRALHISRKRVVRWHVLQVVMRSPSIRHGSGVPQDRPKAVPIDQRRVEWFLQLGYVPGELGNGCVQLIALGAE